MRGRSIGCALGLALVFGAACDGGGSRSTPTQPTQPSPPAAPPDPCARASGPEAMPFDVYVDAGDRRNHFIPSGFFGDTSDLGFEVADTSRPHSGTTSIRIEYRPAGPMGFAGIFWQCPENNFGTVAGAGFDLSRARRVRFFARVAQGTAVVEFKVGGIGHGSPPAPFPESLPATPSGQVTSSLTQDWREFTIDVAGRDLSRVIGGFMFVTSIAQNPAGVTVFLDDIVWE
jgi:hypothetical protein